MFRTFALLAMASLFLVGCATTQQGNTLRNDSTSVEEELAKLPYPFVIVYGEHGAKQVITPDDSSEKYANLSSVLIEPGFIVVIDNATRANGMDTSLEKILKKEGFYLVGSKEHKISGGQVYFQMNFVKNGKRVLFMDD